MKLAMLLALLCLFASPALAVDYRVQEVEFTSHGVTLAGSIVFPHDRPAHSAVVFVHGSGEQTRSHHWAERFASQGIAALVYDKRGVGQSGGAYESEQSVSGMNIDLLADDSVAALGVLSRHPQTGKLPLGLAGISQAGWIIPLAAERSGAADFIVLWSGPVCKVSEEDTFSKYTADRDGKKPSSYAEALDARASPYIWPDFLGRDTDPSESLSRLKIPGLWIFGENDGSVPVDLSTERLAALVDTDHEYSYVVFSGLGHNNMDETFATAVDWIKRLARQSAPKE